MATTTTTKKRLVYKKDPDGVYRIKKEATPSSSAEVKSSNNSSADKSVQDYLDQLINLTYTIVEEPLPAPKPSAPAVVPSTKPTSAGTKLGAKPKSRKNNQNSRANLSDADSVNSDQNTTGAPQSFTIPVPQVSADSATTDANSAGLHKILSPIPKVATHHAPTVNTNLAGGVASSTTASPIKESPSANLPTTLLDLPTTKSFHIPFLSVSMSAPMENLRFHWPSFIGGSAIAIVLQQMSPLLLDQAFTMLNILKNLGIVSAVAGLLLWYLGLIRSQDIQTVKWVLLNMRQRFWAGRVGTLVPATAVAENVEVYDAADPEIVENAEVVTRPSPTHKQFSRDSFVRDPSPLKIPVAPQQGAQGPARPRNVIRPTRGGYPTNDVRTEYVENKTPRNTPMRQAMPKQQVQPGFKRNNSDMPRQAQFGRYNHEGQNMQNSRTLSHDALEKLAKQGYKGVQRTTFQPPRTSDDSDVLPFVNRIRLEDEDLVELEDNNQRPLPAVPLPAPRRRISQDSMQSLGIGRSNTTSSARSVLGTRKNYGEFVAAADDK
ncbi:hypothetical protein CLIB1423_08S00540 [[Candida] railenensis]|uniref:Uncharacterized protein n=1 Tax=[Candida] railenensis TaxID=45579 RepID=A0A9P0VYP8_9ASCO|nr:hypothetical protein CLIB1423_08S00540 [[Candida] railenensis]